MSATDALVNTVCLIGQVINWLLRVRLHSRFQMWRPSLNAEYTWELSGRSCLKWTGCGVITVMVVTGVL